MPLADVASLQSTLVNIMTNHPEDESGAINQWAAAISTWLTSAVVPPAAATTSAAVESAVKGALSGMSADGAGLVAIPAAFAAGAAVVASAGAGPGVATPPPGPPPIVLSSPQDVNAAATHIASVVATWVITGTWTSPAAVVSPWS